MSARRRPELRRVRLELDRTAALLAIERAKACACVDAFGFSTRAELERARLVIAARLVDAATNGKVRPRARQRRAR